MQLFEKKSTETILEDWHHLKDTKLFQQDGSFYIQWVHFVQECGVGW